MRKKRVISGSATIEMAYVMPIFLTVFFLLVTVTFYFHDKCVLYAAAYETAVVGAQRERLEGIYSEEELIEYLMQRTDNKLIFFTTVEAAIDKNLEYVTVDVRASKRDWKIHGTARAMIMRTEEMIYIKEMLENKHKDE